MGTTTNNGWTYPESTDLVKDGATAIETLATDIDTTLGVYSPATPGLVQIGSTITFSGVSIQSVSDVFSATYDAYRIVINAEGTGNATVNFRLRVAGADNSSAIYNRQKGFINNTSVTAIRDSNVTSYTLGPLQNSQRNLTTMEIINPFAALKTTWASQSNLDFYEITLGAGFHDTATSFTGFSLLLSAGTNMTGTVSTYGLAK